MIANEFEYLKYETGKEHLPPVFGTVLNTFPNIHSPDVKDSESIMLYEVLQKIKYNFGFGISVEEYVTEKYLDGILNPAYTEYKKEKFSICYNATFKKRKDLVFPHTPTNIMYLDIDGFKTKDEAKAFKYQIIEKYDWILACNLSLSRLGIHLIIQVDNIIDNQDYNRKYDFISSTYFDGMLDKSAKSLTRYTILPADYDIFINEYPNVLNIDHIYYSTTNTTSDINLKLNVGINVNGTDGYKGWEEKKRRNIISTTCTFLQSDLNLLIANSEQDGLIFDMPLDESLFTSPDKPIYYHDGKWVVEINLNPFKNKKVNDGRRTSTIGMLTMQMIYLNAALPKNSDNKIKYAILNFIQSVNAKICNPPLSTQEVINSVNHNWKKYLDGKMNFDDCFILKRAFWSKRSSIKGNDKRIVTCKIKNEPIVQGNKDKIANAIKIVNARREKVTQMKVAEAAGMPVRTVKKYWSGYKLLVKEVNSKV
jgi:hypothetical protein